jgi:hypothetical protein
MFQKCSIHYIKNNMKSYIQLNLGESNFVESNFSLSQSFQQTTNISI